MIDLDELDELMRGATLDDLGVFLLDHGAAMSTELRRLRAALEKIANEDYRGNKPMSATIARSALEA